MKYKIDEYEIIDHGIEHEQYYQGCGVAFTHFDYIHTGCGDSFNDALDDAFDQIAMGEMREITNLDVIFNAEKKHEIDNIMDTIPTDEMCWYYVSIRYNVSKS